MNKPQNYENTQAIGEFTPINLGGHRLIIMNVEELSTSTGNEYIKVSFDTATNDTQPGYYAASYKSDSRENKKWGGVTTVFPTDREGRTSRQFKTFCTSVEKSNPGFKMVWGAGFCAALRGKAVGGVFGEEEYYNNSGDLKTAHKLFWFRSIEGVEDANIPAKRLAERTEAQDYADDRAHDNAPSYADDDWQF